MANYAYTEMYVTGDNIQLTQFYNLLKFALSEDNPIDQKHEYSDFVRLYSVFIDIDCLTPDKKQFWDKFGEYGVDTRGEIYGIENNIQSTQPNVFISYSSAWDSHEELWKKILKEKFPKLKQYTLCVEEDNGVFYHNDPEGLFFKEKYHLSICYKSEKCEEDYISADFFTEEQLLAGVFNYFKISCKSIAELQNFIDEAQETNSNWYCNIEEYCIDLN